MEWWWSEEHISLGCAKPLSLNINERLLEKAGKVAASFVAAPLLQLSNARRWIELRTPCELRRRTHSKPSLRKWWALNFIKSDICVLRCPREISGVIRVTGCSPLHPLYFISISRLTRSWPAELSFIPFIIPNELDSVAKRGKKRRKTFFAARIIYYENKRKYGDGVVILIIYFIRLAYFIKIFVVSFLPHRRRILASPARTKSVSQM